MIAALVVTAVLAAAPIAMATPGTPTAAPATPATAAPTLTPTAVAPPAPATAPTVNPYKYRYVPRYRANRAADAPQIFAVYLNDKQLHSLGPIRIRVETTENVVKVVSRSNGRDGTIPPVAPGRFEATSVLPKIPFIAAGMSLDLQFIATTAAGKTSIVRVPVLLN